MRHLFECVWIALLLSSAPVSPLLLCSPGYYVNGAACSPCPAGYFNGIVTASGMSTACIACPPGTCNKNAGASVCALCPHYQQNWVDFSVMADSTCACAYTCVPARDLQQKCRGFRVCFVPPLSTELGRLQCNGRFDVRLCLYVQCGPRLFFDYKAFKRKLSISDCKLWSGVLHEQCIGFMFEMCFGSRKRQLCLLGVSTRKI